MDKNAETPTPLRVEREPARHRFVVRAPDGVAELRYRERDSNVLELVHTEVPAQLSGQGIASRLAHDALEYARANGLTVIPTCPFVRAYLERHPEYRDLVVPSA